MRREHGTLIALFMASAMLACAPKEGGAKEPKPTVAQRSVNLATVIFDTPDGPVKVSAEVADTREERRVGLMRRNHLADDAGMLFVFPREGDQSFWMKNTLIPLDMIFINSALRVVGIVRGAAPHSLEPREVGQASRYVLEVNGGWAARRRVQVGVRVRLPGLIR